jgi:hypothetical protein
MQRPEADEPSPIIVDPKLFSHYRALKVIRAGAQGQAVLV